MCYVKILKFNKFISVSAGCKLAFTIKHLFIKRRSRFNGYFGKKERSCISPCSYDSIGCIRYDINAVSCRNKDGALTINTQAEMNTWVNTADYYKDATSVITLGTDVSVTEPVENFAGTFNGGGKTIDLAIDSTDGNAAFIGTLASTGELNNVKFSGSVKSTTTGDYVAAAVGQNLGVVYGVTNTATVEATSAYNVGGIVGYNDHYSAGSVGVVENSKNQATVKGKSKTGGIVGENAGTVASCSNTADIRSYGGGKDGTGGIVGRNGNNNTAVETGVVKECYNTGNISDASATGTTGRWVGGLVGFQNSLSSLVNSYNTGTATGYKDYSTTVGNDEGTTTNSYGEAVSASTLTTTENAGRWIADTNPAELAYNENVTNDPAKAPSTATDFYLGVTDASDENTGVAGKPVATLGKALEVAGASTAEKKVIHVSETIAISGTQDAFGDSNITVQWDGAADDVMFDLSGSLKLGGSTYIGNGVATMFNVQSGASLKVRNNAVLSGAVTAIDVKQGGDLLVNRSSVSGTSYAIKLADSTSICTMSVASGQQITLGGNVYLGTGATIEMAANPADMLASTITVECQSTDAEIIIAVPGTGITFTDSDSDKIVSADTSYEVGVDSGNIIFAK